MRRVLELLLSDQWEVETLEDGRAALRAARAHPPDLAVVDLVMPHLDGLGLLRELRTDLRTKRIPVIMISGVTEEEPRIRALEAGANDFLVKPFSERELLVKMRAQLQIAAERAAEEWAERERDRLLRSERAARAAAEKAGRRAVFLAEARRLLASSLDYESTLASVARLAVPDIADACGVDVRAEDGGIRRLALSTADPAKAEKLRALATGPPTSIDETAGIPRVIRTGQADLYADARLGLRSAIAVPLIARGRTLGAFWFGADESERRYGSEDLAFAQGLADYAALAMDNARLYRAAQEASRIKDDFLATLSHELRTPLNAIMGWAYLLRSGELDREGMTRAAETIDRNARIQSQLIADVLDVSRIVAGRLRLEAAPLELGAVLGRALDTVRASAQAKGIGIVAGIDPTAGLVSGDSDRLQKVFWNLLSNAVKFTPRGGEIRVRLGRVGSHVEAVVEDTGIGISPEFLPHIFERFRQADGSSTRRHGGLGLGLAIARHLVELHGGTLEAASAGHGHGASFTCSLPLLDAPEADALASRIEPALHAPSIEGLSILIVDDDADTRELLSTILERGGARVGAAASAAEALATIDRERPEVLLCDIEMPGESGYELIRRLRARPAERGGRIAAVALTAHARDQDRLEALRAGFQFHMAKPVDPRELVTVVASLAERRT